MITPELRAALEHRGPDTMRAILSQTAPGPAATVYVDSDVQGVPRADVEAWLVEIDAAAKAAKEERRHAQIIRVACWTLAVAAAAAVAGIVAAWPVVQGWLSR
jgi:hypothetical protein